MGGREFPISSEPGESKFRFTDLPSPPSVHIRDINEIFRNDKEKERTRARNLESENELK